MTPRRASGNAVSLTIAVAAISTSGPLVVAIAAPALAIAFWRCALGAGATGLWVAWRQRSELQGLSRRELSVIALGRTVPTRVWLGIGVSLLGVLLLTGIGASIDRSILFGDVLALAGAMLAAA